MGQQFSGETCVTIHIQIQIYIHIHIHIQILVFHVFSSSRIFFKIDQLSQEVFSCFCSVFYLFIYFIFNNIYLYILSLSTFIYWFYL